MTEVINIAEINLKTTIQGDFIKITMMIRHPMETGMRKNEDDNIIAVNFISKVSIFSGVSDKEDRNIEIFKSEWGPGISKDPIMSIRTKALKKGDRFLVVCQNHVGVKQSKEFIVE
jgi:sulfur-oxidizing protein SoxZ